MAIKRYILGQKGNRWGLKAFGDERTIRTFDTQSQGIDYVREMLGDRSVLIKDRSGKFREERTYPRSADPHQSLG